MPRQNLDFSKDFINRTAEQELFDNLLQFNDPARILAIEDKAGTGKTTLLGRLEYKCRWIFYYPVGIVPLESETISSPFAFIEHLRNSYGQDQVFETFDKLNTARVNKIASSFAASPVSMMGALYAQGSVLSGSGNKQVGLEVTQPQQVVINPVTPVPAADWSPTQEASARDACIRGFFDDLKVIAAENPLVILLDSFERCNEDLRVWILNGFLLPLCFNIARRPSRLLVVLAGRVLSDVLNRQGHQQVVKSGSPLSGWDLEHVKAFLKVHGYGNLSDRDVDIIWEKVKAGYSIAKAISLAEALAL
jgi:hypothetical protein